MLDTTIKFLELSDERLTIISDHTVYIDETKIIVNTDTLADKFNKVLNSAHNKGVRIKEVEISKNRINTLIPPANEEYEQYLLIYKRLRQFWQKALNSESVARTEPMDALKLTLARAHSKSSALGELNYINRQLDITLNKLAKLTDQIKNRGYLTL